MASIAEQVRAVCEAPLERAGGELDEPRTRHQRRRETACTRIAPVGRVPDPRELASESLLLERRLAVVDEVADKRVGEREDLPDQRGERPCVG